MRVALVSCFQSPRAQALRAVDAIFSTGMIDNSSNSMAVFDWQASVYGVRSLRVVGMSSFAAVDTWLSAEHDLEFDPDTECR